MLVIGGVVRYKSYYFDSFDIILKETSFSFCSLVTCCRMYLVKLLF